MGRRSTTSTKSGKFMNPTDQARKEARKRELKKNKKQRKLVRETVLKLKDPVQIIEEMLRLDLLEIEGISHDSLNDKVIVEKKKKLQETLTRILTFYEKHDKEKFEEIKKFQAECERKRHKAYSAYQSQKMKEVHVSILFLWMVTIIPEKEEVERQRQEDEETFQLADVALPHSGNLAMEEIPLPQNMAGMSGIHLPSIPLPQDASQSKSNIPQIPGLPPGLIPPGPPPGPPPPPSPEYEDDEYGESSRKDNDMQDEDGREYQSDEEMDGGSSSRRRKVHFDDEEREPQHDDGEDLDGEQMEKDEDEKDDDEDDDVDEDGVPFTTRKRLLKMAGHNPNQPTPGNAPKIMPPGPPPGRPPGPPPGLPPRPPPGMPPMGMPPRLPPGMPPPMRPWGPIGMYPRMPHHMGPQNVIEKGPEIKKVSDRQDGTPVISAKPQIRNIRAEVTKFVPTAVKLRRNPTTAKPQPKMNFPPHEKSSETEVHKPTVEPTKDAVYAKFMEEMTGFL